MISVKARKLLIPYLAVTLIYSVPIKLLSGYYSSSSHPLRDIFVGQILGQGNTYLWFLTALFLIFILTYLLERIIKNKAAVFSVFLLLFVLNTMDVSSRFGYTVNVLGDVAYYGLSFYIGCCFENIREKVNNKAQSHAFIWCAGSFLAVVAVTLLTAVLPDGPSFAFVKKLGVFCRSVSICFMIYMVSFLLSRTGLLANKAIKMIRENTFGLYLYSDPLNYAILSLATMWFGNAVFVSNVGSLLFIASRFFLTAGIALLISLLCKKCKLKYLA